MSGLLTNTKLGNTGVSSLIKSASTLANSLNTYHDTIARLTFENSAKTASDLQTYQDYLNSRIGTLESTGTVTDATKALDMRQTLTSAIHSSASADIQRSTIAVLDGQGTPDQKLAAMGDAFQKLYAVGDLAAAQSYEEQYYSYSQTVQYQKQQAADALASAAKSYSSSYESAVTAAEGTISNNIQDANAAFAAQGPNFLDKQSNEYLKSQGVQSNGAASIFAALAGQVGMVGAGIQLNNTTKYQQGTYTPGSMLDIYTQAIIADPTHADSYKTKIDSYLNGAKGIPLPGEGGKSLTYNALMNTVYAGNSGNSPYTVAQGADGSFQIQAEHVTGYTFGKDQNGNTKLMAAYSLFNTPVQGTNPDGTVTKGSLADGLKKAGLNVKEDSNGDWWFQATNQASFLGKIFGNYPIQGAVQKDGSVEFMGSQGQLYKMVKGDNNLYGVQQLNQFGQVVNANVGGQYGFKPPQSDLVVGKGSTNFMTKVLGDSATPQQVGNKTVYSANGKLYQLVTDTRGLKGLQEIDSSGKIVNANVAGQYGFSPTTLTRGTSNNPQDRGVQFAATLVNQHEQYMNNLTNSKNVGYHNPDALSAFSAPWLSVQSLISNAQIMQSINQAHDQAMAALAAPHYVLQPLPALPAPAPLNVAPSVTQPRLNVAPTAPTSLGNTTATPQVTAPSPQQTVGANLNQSGQSSGIKLNIAPVSGIRLN